MHTGIKNDATACGRIIFYTCMHNKEHILLLSFPYLKQIKKQTGISRQFVFWKTFCSNQKIILLIISVLKNILENFNIKNKVTVENIWQLCK
jgi:hypothetical protein